MDIAELGTFRGITSLYLGMAARLWGAKLHTFDIEDARSEAVKRSWLQQDMILHIGDLETLPGPASDAVAVQRVRGAALLFIDGGMKDLEMWMYNHYARVGTVMFIHDLDYVRYEDVGASLQASEGVQQLLQAFGWEPIFSQAAVDLNSCARVYLRNRLTQPAVGQTWRLGSKLETFLATMTARGPTAERLNTPVDWGHILVMLQHQSPIAYEHSCKALSCGVVHST